MIPATKKIDWSNQLLLPFDLVKEQVAIYSRRYNWLEEGEQAWLITISIPYMFHLELSSYCYIFFYYVSFLQQLSFKQVLPGNR